MGQWANYLLLFLGFAIGNVHGQGENRYGAVGKALEQLRLFDFENNVDRIEALPIDDGTRQQLIYYHEIFREFGYYQDVAKVLDAPVTEKGSADMQKALYSLNKGLFTLLYEYDKEGEAISFLNDALDSAISLGNRPLVCEVIKAIFVYHDRLLVLEDFPQYYLDIYAENTYDTLEEQIFLILKADMGFFGERFLYGKEIIEEIETIVPDIKSEYYKSLAQKVIGYYYFTHKDYRTAIEHHKKAAEYIEERTDNFSMAFKETIFLNIMANQRRMENYREVLELHQNHRGGYIGKTKEYLNSYRYIHLAKAYEELNFPDSAYHYLNQNRIVRNKLNQTYHAAKVSAYRIDRETDAKEKLITKLDKEKNFFQKNFYTILPISGIITAILFIVFFLYKRYKKRSTTLETEKSETLQKLDELKNIVIKNHIILKDKTKVYISDLMYVKSEDHYLNIYTSDDKSHFVRGKLSKIREELPPNFIQCHRSYIVNRNFVKRINNSSLTLIDKTEIPLSRSYRNKF